MKNNKILALLLLFMVSEFSFAADLPHTLKDSATSLGEHASCEAFRLFSAAEREDFETGMGIIQDRILQKTELLGMLRDPSRSLAERLDICDQDFNAQPKKLRTIGTSYSDYVDLILSVYTKTYELAQCIQLASNDSEKNTCQNNLYYYLSYKIIYFQHFIATLPHKVPEHSREDTFFDIIREKLCVGATKEYDVVTQYLKLTMSHGTTNIGIDNQKLYETYNMPLGTLQTEKLGRHPAFHGLIQAQSPEAVALMSQINDRLTPLTHRMSDIHRNLGSRAREFYGQVNSAENQHDEGRVKEDLLKMYQFFWPHVLEAIHAYEEGARETRNALETSEEDLKKWLGIFKDSKEFKKLETREKFYVRSYVERKDKEALQEQRAAEAQRRAIVAAEAEQRRLAAVQKKAEKEARKKERDDALATTQVKHAATPIPLEAATNDFSAMLFSGPDTNTSASASGIIAENLKASPLPTISAPTRQPDVSPTITENCVALATPSPTFSVPTGQPEATLSGFVVPKTKVKTRGSVVGETTEKEEAATSTQSDEKESVILPDYFHDATFQSLIENLLSERNERKLKSEFARLKKDYDIISENQERKNKGYFMVVSPITQKRALKTYHNLHDPENPFASLFMAMRDVLNESQLSIILSGS